MTPEPHNAVEEETSTRESLTKYVNSTTILGAVYIIAGIVALMSPRASQFLLALLIGGVIATVGALDFVASVRGRPIRFGRASLAAVMVAVALFLAFAPTRSARTILAAIAVVLALRGLYLTVHSIRRRAVLADWTWHLARGILFIALAVAAIASPESIFQAIVFLAAGTAIAYGAISLSFAVMHADDEERQRLDFQGYIKQWLSERDVGDDMRENVRDSLYFEEPDATGKQVGFWVLLILSTTIATLAIIADSTAVVIGAMLVAPLMTPILATSAAIVNGWTGRMVRSLATVAGGVVVSVATAWIVTAWTPQLVPLAQNSQVISRTSPTLVDMLIAIAAGAAGAYATVDKRVSSSITGVAIAVALVPPLGVVGLTLNLAAYSDAVGALLLFLTNLVSIILAAAVVFVVTGYVPFAHFRENRKRMRTVLSTVAVGALVIFLPLVFTSEGIIASASRQSKSQAIAEAWLEPVPDLSLNRVEVDNDDIRVVITGKGTPPDVNKLEAGLEEAFKDDITLVVDFFPSTRLVPDP